MFKDIFSGIGKVFTTVVDFAEKNPIATAAVASAAASAFSPDEIDIMRERQRILNEREDSERRRREGNLRVANVDIGFRPSKAKQLLTATGQPVYPLDWLYRSNQRRRPGLINRATRLGA